MHIRFQIAWRQVFINFPKNNLAASVISHQHGNIRTDSFITVSKQATSELCPSNDSKRYLQPISITVIENIYRVREWN